MYPGQISAASNRPRLLAPDFFPDLSMVRWAGGFRYFWGLFCNKPVEMLMISAGSGRTARGVPGEQPEGSPMAPNRFFPGPGFCLDFRPYDRGGGGLEGSPMAPNRIFSAGSFSKKACALLPRGVGVMRGRGADRRKAASGGATLIAVGSPILFSSVHSQVDVGPVSRPDPNGRCLEGSPMAPNRFFLPGGFEKRLCPSFESKRANPKKLRGQQPSVELLLQSFSVCEQFFPQAFFHEQGF
jgi:hypothetical protein